VTPFCVCHAVANNAEVSTSTKNTSKSSNVPPLYRRKQHRKTSQNKKKSKIRDISTVRELKWDTCWKRPSPRRQANADSPSRKQEIGTVRHRSRYATLTYPSFVQACENWSNAADIALEIGACLAVDNKSRSN
jgi:hypothetical protein